MERCGSGGEVTRWLRGEEVFPVGGLTGCKHETTEPRSILPTLRGGRTFDDRSTDDRTRARAGLPAARLDDDSEPIAGTANGCRPKHRRPFRGIRGRVLAVLAGDRG